MDDSAWLIAFLAAGLFAGMLVRRWWLLAVVALGWLVLGAVGLVDANNDARPPEPGNEILLLLAGGLLVAGVLLTALGIAAGRVVASRRANRPQSDTRRHRRSTARR